MNKQTIVPADGGARAPPSVMPVEDANLNFRLETPLSDSLPAGAGTASFCFGSCFHPHRDVVGLELLVDGVAQSATALGRPRLDVFRALHPSLPEEGPLPESDPASPEDPELRSYRSGFWATITLPAGEAGSVIEVGARAKLDDGSVAEVGIGAIPVVEPSLPPGPAAGEGEGLIAVCMATFNPDMDLFRAQVQSLREQTDTNWACVVSDDGSPPARFREIESELGGDPRFTLSRSERRLGVYRNFERGLTMIPPEASLVALCDQDDRWYPDKLEVLRGSLGDAQLVYSDQRLIDAAGTVLANTYWTQRRNNHEDLISLLLANTITGAASLMRREVVERSLPFPEVPADQYHDHWLGLVAMAIGDVAYVDRPLYDYVQHGGATLGHAAANAGVASRRATRWRDNLTVAHWRSLLGSARPAYFLVYVRLEVLARVLLARVGPGMARSKRRSLERFSRPGAWPLRIAWFALRMLRGRFGGNEALGVDLLLIQGMLWPPALALRARGVTGPGRFNHDASMPRAAPEAPGSGFRDPVAAHIRSIISPLEISVSEREPARVNVLIPTIDLKHFFGGYIAKFNLARRLAESGRRVRIVAVDPTPPLLAGWREQIESYSGLDGVMSKLEVAFARDSAQPLAISPDDRFVATTWWTAHVARSAVAQTRADRFVYLIQEFEPFTFEMGSLAALAKESYGFPHLAVFSTEFLREYFAHNGYGVFAAGEAAGREDSVSFRNAITPVQPPSGELLTERESRRLLFYARSEPHARRNMFELGLIALSEAIERGIFGPGWELFGIGSVSGQSRVALSGGMQLDIHPRRAQAGYGEMLGAHDVGLSLMFTPHPSLVPIEMASAGLLTVTNSFETKTPESMGAISSNLITAEPSIEGVVAGLAEAVGRVDDHAGRVAGAAVDWSDKWDESFADPLIAEINAMLDRC